MQKRQLHVNLCRILYTYYMHFSSAFDTYPKNAEVVHMTSAFFCETFYYSDDLSYLAVLIYLAVEYAELASLLE